MNASDICGVVRQIKLSCEQISDLAMASQSSKNTSDRLPGVYEELLLDEVAHVQVLTLELTRLLTDDGANTDSADGGVFAPGDLQYTNRTRDPDDDSE